MSNWNEDQERRINGMVQPVRDIRYPRIRHNRVSRLEHAMEELLEKSRRGGTESAFWRKEASLLREAIRRIKEAQMETDSIGPS